MNEDLIKLTLDVYHQEPMLVSTPKSLRSRQGIGRGMRPSFTMLKDTLAPTSITSLRVIWAATVTRPPGWTKIGNGSILSRSRVNGSGLPPEKFKVVDTLKKSSTHCRSHIQLQSVNQ